MPDKDWRDRTTETMDYNVAQSEKCYYVFRIHPLSHDQSPVAVRLGGSLVLGRSPGEANALVLDDDQVSRNHAELRRCSPGPYVVVDRDSKNGVFVDGVRVSSRTVVDGSIIRIGKQVFVFRELGLDLPEAPAPDAGFVGFSPGFRHAEESCRRVAETRTTVLLIGETGTGKELLARHVHRHSGRAGKFVPVNCAALSPALFESALFGHKKGAFTGASNDFAGLARVARGGTLFLDEVGELPQEVQAKLLRFLEAGELATVGSSEPGTVELRVVAATNRDLEAAMEEGGFRRDLYARLAQWVVRIPPLRERPEDTLLLAVQGTLGNDTCIDPDVAEALALHDWPYNVRELQTLTNEISLRLNPGDPITLDSLPEGLRTRVFPRRDERSGTPSDGTDSDVPTKEELETLLSDNDDNVSRVARSLGKDRKQVYRWMDRYGLR